MRIRLTVTLSLLMALAVALPGPAAAVALLGTDGGSDMSGPVTGGSGGTPTDTPPTNAPPTATPSDTPPAPDDGATAQATYSYSVYRAHTHSVQKTDWYCVPTSIQMMINLTKGTSDKSRANQDKYWRYAQDNSRYPITDNGADAAGWAAALRHWGAGNYTVGINTSMQSSLRAAAKRMRLTGKPVGLIVWGRHGGHAWVMTGFKSTADPKYTDTYTVTSAQAMGPLWPYGTIGGKPFDPGPQEWLSYNQLQNKFTENVQHNAPAWDGRWLTVLP